MRLRRSLTGTVAAFVVLAAPALLLQAPDTSPVDRSRAWQEPGPRPPASDLRALVLLERAVRAPTGMAYEGTKFVSAWSPTGTTSLVVDVRHFPRSGTVTRVRGTATSPAGETFAPDSAGVPGGATSDYGAGVLGLLARNYDVTLGGHEQVAGRTARVVEAYRPAGALAARFWLDARTGLLLRREVFDRSGRTVRASAYVSLRLRRPDPGEHLPPMQPAPWRERVSGRQLAGLRADGWTCPQELPHNLSLYDARRFEDPQGPIVHLSYSDGLSTVSVFEQRGQLELAGLTGWRSTHIGGASVHMREGVPQRITWSADGTVYTVLADAAPETVADIVRSLPHERVDNGTLARVRRGLGRVASWVNPFG